MICRQKLNDYYREGTWSGCSVARLIFDMADALSKVSNDHLWCAILGATSLFLVERSSDASHQEQMSELRQHCLRLNIEEEPTGGMVAAAMAEDETDSNLINRDGRIRYEPEYRFMLTRHWSLFQGMLHSRYLATRLGVWREGGRRMLETLLVKMGIPLVQSMHDWSAMDPELKGSLAARLARHAPDFGLGTTDSLMYGSYVREYGYVMRMTASDAVYALMALLEAPNSPNEGPYLGDELSIQPSSAPLWIRNFYHAFDALDYHHTEKIKRGAQLAMKQQQVILHEATTILSHRMIRYGRRFRYIILRHSPDIGWLANHPVSLSKLALFLVEALRGSKRAHLPLLVAAHLSGNANDTFQVVATNGTTGKQQQTRPSHDNKSSQEDIEGVFDPSKNKFGMAFRLAAQRINARVRHDGFEMAGIEVNAEDLKAFINALQSINS